MLAQSAASTGHGASSRKASAGSDGAPAADALFAELLAGFKQAGLIPAGFAHAGEAHSDGTQGHVAQGDGAVNVGAAGAEVALPDGVSGGEASLAKQTSAVDGEQQEPKSGDAVATVLKGAISTESVSAGLATISGRTLLWQLPARVETPVLKAGLQVGDDEGKTSEPAETSGDAQAQTDETLPGELTAPRIEVPQLPNGQVAVTDVGKAASSAKTDSKEPIASPEEVLLSKLPAPRIAAPSLRASQAAHETAKAPTPAEKASGLEQPEAEISAGPQLTAVAPVPPMLFPTLPVALLEVKGADVGLASAAEQHPATQSQIATVAQVQLPSTGIEGAKQARSEVAWNPRLVVDPTVPGPAQSAVNLEPPVATSPTVQGVDGLSEGASALEPTIAPAVGVPIDPPVKAPIDPKTGSTFEPKMSPDSEVLAAESIIPDASRRQAGELPAARRHDAVEGTSPAGPTPDAEADASRPATQVGQSVPGVAARLARQTAMPWQHAGANAAAVRPEPQGNAPVASVTPEDHTQDSPGVPELPSPAVPRVDPAGTPSVRNQEVITTPQSENNAQPLSSEVKAVPVPAQQVALPGNAPPPAPASRSQIPTPAASDGPRAPKGAAFTALTEPQPVDKGMAGHSPSPSAPTQLPPQSSAKQIEASAPAASPRKATQPHAASDAPPVDDTGASQNPAPSVKGELVAAPVPSVPATPVPAPQAAVPVQLDYTPPMAPFGESSGRRIRAAGQSVTPAAARKPAGTVVAQLLALSGQMPHRIETVAPPTQSSPQPGQLPEAAAAMNTDLLPEDGGDDLAQSMGPQVRVVEGGTPDRGELAFSVRMQAPGAHDVAPPKASADFSPATSSPATSEPALASAPLQNTLATAQPLESAEPAAGADPASLTSRVEAPPRASQHSERRELPNPQASEAADSTSDTKASAHTAPPSDSERSSARENKERRPAPAQAEHAVPPEMQQSAPKAQNHTVAATAPKLETTPARPEIAEHTDVKAPETLEADTKLEAAKPGAVRDVKFEITGDERRVEVRLSERAGEIKLTVRTPDGPLAGTLRENLPQLSARLAESGLRNEAWHPAATSKGEWRNTAETSQSGGTRDGEQQPGQQDRGSQGGDQRRQRNHSPEPTDSTLGSKQKGKDFAWLMSSLR